MNEVFDLSPQVKVAAAQSFEQGRNLQGRLEKADFNLKRAFDVAFTDLQIQDMAGNLDVAKATVQDQAWEDAQNVVDQEMSAQPARLEAAKSLARSILSRDKNSQQLLEQTKQTLGDERFDHVLVAGIRGLAEELSDRYPSTTNTPTQPDQDQPVDWAARGWDDVAWNAPPTFANPRIEQTLATLLDLQNVANAGVMDARNILNEVDRNIGRVVANDRNSPNDKRVFQEAAAKIRQRIVETTQAAAEAEDAPTPDRHVIGYALRNLGNEGDARQVADVKRTLERVGAFPDQFGQDYPQAVIDQYNELVALAEASNITDEQALQSLLELQLRAIKGGRDWVEIDLTNPDHRLAFGSALRGLNRLSRGEITTFLTPPVPSVAEMLPVDREMYYARVTGQLIELFGLDVDEIESDYLLQLLGDIAAIRPHEMRNIAGLMERNFARTFQGKMTDELLVLMDAFSGGEQGGTYEHALALSDIGKMGIEDWGKHLMKIKPNELFFLANLPFKVADMDGTEITITPRELVDFLLTPEGMKTFRMNPYDGAKHGVTEYINWLQAKYPEAERGLKVLSGLKVANTQKGGMRPAEVLDDGKTAITETTEDAWIKMATNPTWLKLFRMSQGMVNALVNRGMIYRDGHVFKVGPEWQKSANMWPFYLEAYALFDGEIRDTLPRFRSLSEYMMPTNPVDWFGDQKGLEPDNADPFHPRPVGERNRGVQVLHTDEIGGKEYNDEMIARDRFDMVRLFYGVEDDPAETNFQDAVAELVAAKAGFYYDDVGERHDFTPYSDDQLRKLAWDLKKKIDGKVWTVFSKKYEPTLETIMKYRTFYPLPQEVVLQRLESVPPRIRERMERYDFSGMVKRMGGTPSANCVGVEGMKEVAQIMGNRIFTAPRWGTVPQNATDKHQGYEATMIEIQKSVVGMQVGANQARAGEAEELASLSIGRGHHSFEERFIHIMDNAIQKARGIQPDPNLRGTSLKEYYENFIKAVSAAGMMTNNKGIWWVYRRAWKRAEFMAGLPTMPKYIAEQPYVIDGGQKKHNPVIFGVHKTTYKKLYGPANYPTEALAILGCHVDDGNIVYSAHAGGIHPIAMVAEGDRARVDPEKVNTAELSGHLRQLDERDPKAVHALREGLMDIIADLEIDALGAAPYYEMHADHAHKATH